ncbi:hypothetical protein GCM10009814_40590 [Lapillicoccus jejuensis]
MARGGTGGRRIWEGAPAPGARVCPRGDWCLKPDRVSGLGLDARSRAKLRSLAQPGGGLDRDESKRLHVSTPSQNVVLSQACLRHELWAASVALGPVARSGAGV